MPSLYHDTLFEKEDKALPGYLVPCFNIYLPEICNEVASSDLDPTTAAALASNKLTLIDLKNGKSFYQHTSYQQYESTTSTFVSQEYSNLEKNKATSKPIEADSDAKAVKSSHLAWHPNSTTLLGSSTENGSVCLIDYRVPSAYSCWAAHIGKLSDLKFLQGNNFSHIMATAGYEDGWLYFWDMRKPGCSLKGLQFPHSISKIALSRDGSLLAISNRKADLQFFSLPLISPLSHLGYRPSISATNSINHLEFSLNGRIIMITGSEETTSKTRDAIGIDSYPICEVLDLQDPHKRSQMSNPASFWLNMENYNNNNSNDIELNSSSGHQKEDALLADTTWKYFPRGVLIDNTLIQDDEIDSTPYSLLTNRLHQTPKNDTEYNKPFFDSDDENSYFYNNSENMDPFTSSKKQKLEIGKAYQRNTDQLTLHRNKLFKIYKTSSNSSSDFRPYCCRFIGDLIAGVGGPEHMGGAMKLWDPMSGLMLSATVSQESKDPMTSLCPLGKSFLLSSGWDSEKEKGKITLWSYTIQEQLQLLGMI